MKYIITDSNKSYEVQNQNELVEIIKNSNSHTKHLGIDEYVDQQSSIMINLFGVQNNLNKNRAEFLVNAWIEKKIVRQEY